MTETQKRPALSLEDIRPVAAEFTLESTGKTYKLRPVNMDDELWIRKRFGEQIEAIFRDIRIEEICEIVFHQLTAESREEFLAKDVTLVNEDGERITERRGGSKLLRCLLLGLSDKLLVFNALMQTLGISRPLIDRITAEEAKIADVAEKKSRSMRNG